MVWPLLGSIAAPLIGGALGLIGQERANQQTEASTAKQMAFQERMSNTSYQRGMADMEAAGLNPILAYKQGGAGSPSGASYTAGNIGAAAMDGASSAQSINRSVREQDLAKDLLGAQVDVTNQEARNKIEARDLIRAQTNSAKAAASRDYAQTAILGETLQSAKAAAAIAKSDEEFYKTDAGKKLRQLNRVITNLIPGQNPRPQ